ADVPRLIRLLTCRPLVVDGVAHLRRRSRVRARPRGRLGGAARRILSAVRTAPAAFHYKVRAKTGPRAKSPRHQATAVRKRGCSGAPSRRDAASPCSKCWLIVQCEIIGQRG